MSKRITTGPSPFIKWVGGKSGLLSQLTPLLPKDIKSRRYIEPFVGGGALFFHLQPTHALLCDINNSLVMVYHTVRDNVEKLIICLRELNKNHSTDHYYKIRALYNNHPSYLVEQSARFIYLNKTCFNGLYRVNKKSQFNVPAGRYKNPRILDENLLRLDSQALQNTEIMCSTFEYIVNEAREDDFIYFDPPYDPVSQTANFTSYSSNGFSRNDQVILRDTFVKLDKVGCKLMLSNSNTAFIRDLYKNFNQLSVYASRAINCDKNKRGQVSELVIRNY